ncbi:MAG: BCAM0308 family protein [Patescibacteria group bacterium]|nr:BCAM0308 family protein [Patescibacteria group bacterium]
MDKISIKMQRQKKGSCQPRVPKPRKEEAEFGPGKVNIIICKDCGAVYFYKSWHHYLEKHKKLFKDKPIKSAVCPACQMIRDKMFEGQIILKNMPADKKNEILESIQNIGKRAFKRDPMDRIISVKEKNGEIEILTTENQLAVSIAKQIKRAFKGEKAELKISWSHQESVVRVILNFGL